MMESVFVIRRADGQFFTGDFDDFTTDLQRAKFYTKLETEVAFLHRGEEWYLIPYTDKEGTA
jgi:hypothetical protein